MLLRANHESGILSVVTVDDQVRLSLRPNQRTNIKDVYRFDTNINAAIVGGQLVVIQMTGGLSSVVTQEEVVDLVDAHADLTNNPHLVTAAQAGADPAGSASGVQSNLTTHEGDSANPHSVTAVQAGADPTGSAAGVQSNLTTHEGDSANPHSVTKSQVSLGNVANVDQQNAGNITSGTLDGDRLPAMSATKKGAVPLTGTPSGKFLKDDGTWDTAGGGGAPGGVDTQVQYNNSGAFGGMAGVTWDNSENFLTFANSATLIPNGSGYNSIKIGKYASPTGSHAIGVGYFAQAKGSKSMALGYNSYTAANEGTMAIGYDCKAIPTRAIAIGTKTGNYGSESLCIGSYGNVYGTNGVGIGFAHTCNGSRSVAIGNDAYTGGAKAVAVGGGSSMASDGVAIGADCFAQSQGVSIGYLAGYSGSYNNAVAIGFFAHAGNGNVSVGQSTSALGNYCIAIGNAAATSGNNKVQIGNSGTSYNASIGDKFVCTTDNTTGGVLSVAGYVNVTINGSVRKLLFG